MRRRSRRASAQAVIETYDFSDPLLEERYQELSAELRCPKCQNQNIADSNAPIAKDLRKILYQQLEDGASDREILDYMVARYGEFVRYRPRFSGDTAILWLAPVLFGWLVPGGGHFYFKRWNHGGLLLAASVAKQRAAVNRISDDFIEYDILKRDAETNRQLYEGLLQRLKEAGIPFSFAPTFAIPNMRHVYVYDPAMNLLEINEVVKA